MRPSTWLERRIRVAGDDADRLLVELRFVGVDHRRQPPREIGFRLGCDKQDCGPAGGDPPGLGVAPLALSVKYSEAVGEVWRDGLRRKLGPFDIGQRLAPLDIAAEEQFSDEHVLFGRQQTGVRGRRQLGAAGEQQQPRQSRHGPIWPGWASDYSAAALTAAGSTLAAQNLNSGILPKGSSWGLVSTLAAASAKQKGMNTCPGATALSARAFNS